MVLLMSAACLAVQGGIAAKHKLETRRNPTLDGDFIVAPPSQPQRRSLPPRVQQVRRSLSKLAQSLTSQGSSSEEASNDVSYSYSTGQEVLLKDMNDDNLNGTKALVMQDFGGSRGVLVQFLEQKHGHDNYHESGIMLLHENVEAIDSGGAEDSSSSSSSILTIPVGTLVELQNLSAHSQKNGLRGMVAEPSGVMAKGRIAVQLMEDLSCALVSVKLENCIVIEQR